MDERTLKYAYILVDVEVVGRWLDDQNITVNDKQAEKIIEYIYQDVLDRAYDLVMDGYDDLKED